MPRDDALRTAAFDCLMCGMVFFDKAERLRCPDCRVLMRRRGPGERPPEWYVLQTCAHCPDLCEVCAAGIAWAEGEIARLEAGGEPEPLPAEPNGRRGQLDLFEA